MNFLGRNGLQHFYEPPQSADVAGKGGYIESQTFRLRMIQEYYRQMRKFGCNILAVIQQYNIIKDSGRKRRDDW